MKSFVAQYRRRSLIGKGLQLFIVLLFCGGGAAALVAAGPDEPDERVRVRVVAERFNFTPSKIQVSRGTALEIELVSEDTFHGFRIPSVGLDVTIPARGRGSVKVLFRANREGKYAFECSRPCGAGHTMMRGRIVVE